jgi:lipopolysaccharide export system protein LptC
MKQDRRRFSMAPMLLLVTLMALGSFWLLQIVRAPDNSAGPAAARTEPDYYVDNFNFVRLSATGEAQYNIAGKRMVHNPADDTHTIDLPVINSLSRERPPMTARSKRAIVEPGGVKIHMYDDVKIDRPKTPQAENFHLESDNQIVLAGGVNKRTAKPVRLTLGGSTLNGAGMVANNATGELSLASRVQATLPPRQTAIR